MISIDIKDYLKAIHGNETVFYYPNPGNAGDSLIAHATLNLFHELDIKYRLFNEKSFEPSAKVLMYGGGGNLVGYYSQARDFIQKYHRQAKKFVILPHTIAGNEDLLAQFNENVDIITREEVTYHHVKKYAPKANTFLAHDLVFDLNVQTLLSDIPPLSIHSVNLTLPARIVLYSTYIQMKHLTRKVIYKKKNHVLNCFRDDQEKSDIDFPKDNIDVSSIFSYGTDSEVKAFYTSWRLVNFINDYKEIRTNRLHVGIAGALLGKEVKLYPNSYHKCGAVYYFSMKGRFPNVRWMG